MTISRRAAIGVAGALAAAGPVFSAETGKVYRIGMITYADQGGLMDTLETYFAGHGYRKGVNVVYERRAGGRDKALTQRYAEELVAWKPDLIVSMMTNADLAVRKAIAGTPIPAIFWSADPVESGIVDSFAKPGGNLTGVTSPVDVQLLQLRFLKEVLPDLKAVGMLYNPTYGPAPAQLRQLQQAGRLFEVKVGVYQALTFTEIEPALAKMAADGLKSFVVGPHELFNTNGQAVGAMALKHRLAAASIQTSVLSGGGVVCYGPDFSRIWPAAVAMGHRILQGTPPRDIPIDRKIQCAVSVNRGALRTLGLTAPDYLLEEADRVI